MSVLGETAIDGQEFSIVNVIVSFGIIEGLRMKAYCDMFAPIILLREDGSCGKGRSVYLEKERLSELGLSEAWV